jgi:ribosomal protein L37E
LLMAVMFPRTSPWRWTYWDLGYLLPVALCIAVSALPKTGAGLRARAISGFCQSLAFLAVFAHERVSLRDPVDVTAKWIIWVIMYTLAFTVVTQGVVALSKRGQGNEERCEKCGYILYGLQTPRCPECGTAFDRTRITAQRPSSAGTEAGRERA